jgi:hypothetical protein
LSRLFNRNFISTNNYFNEKYNNHPITRVSAMLHAQNSVSGKVTDKDNNPVVGVSVYAPELHKGTDAYGIIRSNLPLVR